MKQLCLKTVVVAIAALSVNISSTSAMAKEPPLLDLGAEMKAKTGGVPKVTYEDRQTITPKPPKPDTVSENKTVDKKTDSANKQVESNKPVHWGYSGETGPRYWGELSEDFATCKEGKNQSPVNLKNQTGVGTTNLPELSIYYQDVPYRVINNGHTLQINYPLGSYVKIGNKRFELLQLHFHTPSEHQLEGFNYPMEVHMVHKDGDGNYAVMAVIFREGEFNDTLQVVLDHLPKDINKQQIHKDSVLNPVMFIPGNTDFYQYSGSLTTPPCSEGVYWMVFKNPIEASAEQLQQMNEVMGENARPVQDLNARHVLKSWAEQLQEPPMYEFY